MRALPSKRRLGSFSSRVRSELAQVRDLHVQPLCEVSASSAQGEYLPGSTTDLGEGELDAPHLALVAQTVFSDDLQLGVTMQLLDTMYEAQHKAGTVIMGYTHRRAASKGRRGTL